MKTFKKWFWSAHVQDQFRSSTVDILWIALTLADGNLIDFLMSIYTGDAAVLTVSGIALLISRIVVRSTVLFIVMKLKRKFPELLLPRDFAEPTMAFTTGTKTVGSLTRHKGKKVDSRKK